MNQTDNVQQGPPEPVKPWTQINSAQDLIDFLAAVHPALKQNEVHAEYRADNYRLVVAAKVIDDQIILRLDTGDSEPFYHDE